MNTQDFMIVSQDQAALLERAGVPVEIQYMVRVEQFKNAFAPKPEPAPQPAPTATKEKAKAFRIAFGHDSKLRWTGLKWDASEGTQAHLLYQILKTHFEQKGQAQVMKRDDLSKLLTREMSKRNLLFHAHTLTMMCKNRYLELVVPTAGNGI